MDAAPFNRDLPRTPRSACRTLDLVGVEGLSPFGAFYLPSDRPTRPEPLRSATILATLRPMALFPLFGQKDNPWRTGTFPAPWEPGRPSLYADLAARLAAGEDLEEADLTDQPLFDRKRRFRTSAGMMDNLVGADTGAGETAVALLRDVLRRPTPEAISQFYALLCEKGVISLVDEAIDALYVQPPDWAKFATFFRWLATTAPDREPAKFAIAMLGRLQETTYRDLFLTFGAHGEFTKFAAVALTNTLPPDESFDALWSLARRLKGWGRIDIVCRLAREPTPEFQHWLVREGFRNSIMNEYLAHEAAADGDLLGQLSQPDAGWDAALLDGAAGIFSALVAGGPVEDISGYGQAPTAVFRWLDHVNALHGTLPRADAAEALYRFATESEAWPSDVRTEVKTQTDTYLAKSEIRSQVQDALKNASEEDEAFWLARALTSHLGIDRWPVLFARQKADPTARHWFDLMEDKDPDRIDQVIAYAEDTLPLDRIASGPGTELGLGPDWRDHDSLTFVVQGLASHPGKGWTLIKSALRSPVSRLRNNAVWALKSWPKSHWPPGALGVIRKATLEEPTDQLKAALEDLVGPG